MIVLLRRSVQSFFCLIGGNAPRYTFSCECLGGRQSFALLVDTLALWEKRLSSGRTVPLAINSVIFVLAIPLPGYSFAIRRSPIFGSHEVNSPPPIDTLLHGSSQLRAGGRNCVQVDGVCRKLSANGKSVYLAVARTGGGDVKAINSTILCAMLVMLPL